ncbi:MAG: GGDEF domain-containing protein [Clostridia bacterium]|nr:GGDEF domain-containing protein [Clostridia bacterium]
MKQSVKKNKVGGISANAMMTPIVIALAILHAMIIVVIMLINRSSGELSMLMQRSGAYTQDATSLLAGSSLLSETASGYVLMPVLESGEVNVGPLFSYAEELDEERRGGQVVARFEEYDVEPGVIAYLKTAAESADQMLQAQLHAIALMRQVYPLPPAPQLEAIPAVELSGDELAMSDAQKEAAAKALLLGQAYSVSKHTVSENVNSGVELLQANYQRRVGQAVQRVSLFRTLLWIVTVSIMAILVFLFVTLLRQLFLPLNGFVQLINSNEMLDERKGLREVRLVAAAYNDLRKRRDAVDAILKSAAETDALTNLPNRYRFEQYLLESEESGYSMAVLLFDINFLKVTNDNQGHLAGDELIRSAAECISSCFGPDCFRFGGDEFAAVLKNCAPRDINDRVKRFDEAQKRENVSISLGCAYAPEIGETTFKQLLEEADRNMYIQKRKAHMRAG